MNISAAQNKATSEFVDLIAESVGGPSRTIHPETAIATSARMAGSLLFRSFGFAINDAEPGSVVLSDGANEKGPMLMNIVLAFLAQNNVQMDQGKLGASSRGAEPTLSFMDSVGLVQGQALRIAQQNRLDLQQAAQSAALATAFVVMQCAPQIGAETGFNVAAFGFVEGSKTMPPDLEVGNQKQDSGKPWYKFW